MKKLVVILFVLISTGQLHAQAWVPEGRVAFGKVYFEVYDKNTSWGMGQQFFGTNFYNGTGYKLHVTGEFYAVLLCGNEAVSKLDFTVEANSEKNKVKPASTGPPDGYLTDATGLLGTADEEKCKGNEVTINGRKTYVRIKQLGIRKLKLSAVQADGTEIPVSGNGDLLQPVNNTRTGTPNAPATNNANNTYTPPQNAAPKANNNNVQQQQQSEEIKNRMLAQLQQSQQNFTDQFNNAVENVADMVVQGMIRKSLRDENASRSKRFNELEQDVRTKKGSLADCDHCNGQGSTRCKQCNGSGKKTCTVCFGTGKYMNSTCAGCKGTGQSYCMFCNATGNYFCTYCSGTGKEFKEDNTNSYSGNDNTDNNSTTGNANSSGNGYYDALHAKGHAMTLGDSCLQRGYFKTAIDYYTIAGNYYRDYSQLGTQSDRARLLSKIAYCYERLEDYRTAMQYDEILLKFGNDPSADWVVNATEHIGTIYKKGSSNVPRDEQKAMEYYKRAAALGSRSAMTAVGDMYFEKDNGTFADHAIAVDWYKKAADPNYVFSGDKSYVIPMPQTMEKLGNMYRNGFGVLPNAYTALTWYKKAAEWIQLRERGIWNIENKDPNVPSTFMRYHDDFKTKIKDEIMDAEEGLNDLRDFIQMAATNNGTARQMFPVCEQADKIRIDNAKKLAGRKPEEIDGLELLQLSRVIYSAYLQYCPSKLKPAEKKSWQFIVRKCDSLIKYSAVAEPMVFVFSTSQGRSYYKHTDDNNWGEFSCLQTNPVFNFTLIRETDREKILYDQSRNVYVRLTQTECFWSRDAGTIQNKLYDGSWIKPGELTASCR